MGLLDDFTPRYKPKDRGYVSPHDRLSEEEKLGELNNMEHDEMAEDYSDSPHLNY